MDGEFHGMVVEGIRGKEPDDADARLPKHGVAAVEDFGPVVLPEAGCVDVHAGVVRGHKGGERLHFTRRNHLRTVLFTEPFGHGEDVVRGGRAGEWASFRVSYCCRDEGFHVPCHFAETKLEGSQVSFTSSITTRSLRDMMGNANLPPPIASPPVTFSEELITLPLTM
jgi:hypothetical protein